MLAGIVYRCDLVARAASIKTCCLRLDCHALGKIVTDDRESHGATTLDPEQSQRVGASQGSHLCLVVTWWREDPGRVGEVLIPQPTATLFGRHTEHGRGPRSQLVRQRPGKNHPSPPLEDPYLSRHHLRIARVLGQEALSLQCPGRRKLMFRGVQHEDCEVRAGDVIEVEGLCSFVCVERPPQLSEAAATHPFGEADPSGIVGESPAAWALRRRILFASKRSAHVLITGPSGAGKELVARAIHQASDRRRKTLVSRNASTIPASLAAAELFGNAPGYPNAGMSERCGLIGQAEGSTLFLDEMGELPTDVQSHLLRVLDGGEYHRLGDARARIADLRFIAATNRPSSELKPDLAARFMLRVIVPGLEQRVEDIPLIARHLIRSIARQDASLGERYLAGWDGHSGEPRFSSTLMNELVSHAYATHVRELTALLWLSLETSSGPVLEHTDAVRAALDRQPLAPAGSSRSAPRPALIEKAASMSRGSDAVSPEALRAALARHGGTKERVWRELGLSSRHALHRLIKKFGAT
jgi:DNA-binding NtrC family response regulator